MKKFYVILAGLLSVITTSRAQDDKGFRFGIQASPVISWMSSNNKDAESQGANVGINFGLMGEHYFSENYAFTGGISFIINKGGSLLYDKAGEYLQKSDFSDELQTAIDLSDTNTVSGSRLLPAGTKIARRTHTFSIPLGFKMRTNEIGDSYIRAFAQIPVLTFDIITRGRGDIGADALGGFYEKEIIYRDIFPIGITVGGGAGIEWYPNDKDMSFVAGIFYNGGLIDLTKDDGTKSAISDVTVRLGVMF